MKKLEKAIEVQSKLYGLEAVYKACYAFLDRVYVKLEGEPEGVIRVLFRPKDPAKVSCEALAGEFENELLHQALRVKVADSNRKIREYIVTQALMSAQGVNASPASKATSSAQPADSNGSVLDEELEKEIEKLLAEVEKSGSSGGDPLKIAAPWDEKKGAPEGSLKVEAATAGGDCGCGPKGCADGEKEGGKDAFEV
jgi:His-Xaa-Ser system protein HxsD